jgi:hypothetical protein
VHTTISFNLLISELRSRRIGELVRSLAVRLWPFKVLMRQRYSARLRSGRWYSVNATARRLYVSQPPSLSAQQSLAVSDLKRVGLHQTNFSEFVASAADYQALRGEIDGLLQDYSVRRQIRERNSKQGSKWYVVRAFGLEPRQPVPSSLAKFVLSDQVLNMANAYLGLQGRLIYLDVWHNLSRSHSEPPISSEYWHRDHEDIRIVKMFLYLTDVDEWSGPLEYLCDSQAGGRYDSVFPSQSPYGSYPQEDALRRMIPEWSARLCVGPAGTLVFWDSSGFHRGGRVVRGARQVLVATFASDASTDTNRYRLADPSQYEGLSPAARYAIRAPG